MKDTFLKNDKNNFSKGLKPLELLILAQVEEFDRNEKECYMTNKQFADLFSVTQPTVDKALERLEELKLIKRVTQTVTDRGRANKVRKLILVKAHASASQVTFKGYSF